MNFTNYLLLSLIEMIHIQMMVEHDGKGENEQTKKADKLMQEIYEQVRKKDEYDSKNNGGVGGVEYKPQPQKTNDWKKRLWK